MPLAEPVVSICIPAYEEPELLQRCLDSIVMQTYRAYEVIITDDSQVARLNEVVDKINDSRICYYKNSALLGSPGNWNAAIAFAKGKYIKILHQDDWFASAGALESFVKAFEEQPDIDFTFSSCYNVSSSSSRRHSPTNCFLKKLKTYPSVLLYLNGIGAPSVTMFKNRVQRVLFNTDTKWYVDVIFYIEFLKRKNGIRFIKEPLVNVRTGSAKQVTNMTVGKTKVAEAIYAFAKFGYFDTALPMEAVFFFCGTLSSL